MISLKTTLYFENTYSYNSGEGVKNSTKFKNATDFKNMGGIKLVAG